jgi:uncharacterized membrane protein SirB2
MIEHYAALKAIHVACVAASGAFFAVRGFWMLRAPHWLARRWVRVLPHVVDTMLLASAVALAIAIRNYPATHAWLTAKVAGLVAYVVLGSIALRRGRTRGIRSAAFAAALVAYAYIVSVALTRSPAGFLRALF